MCTSEALRCGFASRPYLLRETAADTGYIASSRRNIISLIIGDIYINKIMNTLRVGLFIPTFLLTKIKRVHFIDKSHEKYKNIIVSVVRVDFYNVQ
jgi:hypothetical protein